MEKTCFKCNQKKLLTEFYRHKQMGDGYLGKCKKCTRIDTKNNVAQKDKHWHEKERERQRVKASRLRSKFSEKHKANRCARSIPANVGEERHHWSYHQDHMLDVIILKFSDHRRLHQFLRYSQPAKAFVTIWGDELFTKEKHLEFLEYVLNHTDSEVHNNFSLT